MQINKRKVILKNSDINLKLSIKNKNNFIGVDDDLNQYLDNEIDNSINDVSDDDIIVFRRKNNQLTLKYFFYQKFEDIIIDGLYIPTLKVLGYEDEDLLYKREVSYKSFFMVEIFDSYNTSSQKKIHIGLLPLNITTPTYNITTVYNDLNNYEFLNIYLSNSFLKNKENLFFLYSRFSFYDSKTGKFTIFYNKDLEDQVNDSREYFKILMNKNNREYSYITNNDELLAYENLNENYVNKQNNTIKSNENLKPNFPKGLFFNSDGSYQQ